ncbi:MAG: hypothetical protein H6599_09795, partial [Flavobacteriales bacterium]|nr:hypothetical protein [Flavobacteriales bacterium]
MNYLKTILILSSLFFIACNSNQKAEETPPPLYPQPIMVEANPKEGYKVNVVTGDTIHPIILESGDTLITGVPIPATGKVINPDSLDQPQVFQAPSDDQLVKINAKTNVYKIPDELTVIPVNKDSLTIIWLEEISEKDTAHYIVNTNGDTIKTGVPIPVKGKVVPTTQP